jgi:hypothetical protein
MARLSEYSDTAQTCLDTCIMYTPMREGCRVLQQ